MDIYENQIQLFIDESYVSQGVIIENMLKCIISHKVRLFLISLIYMIYFIHVRYNVIIYLTTMFL
ncbi:hypothetical protein CMALT394_290010 [Carnobacterium maltaromaticum]|nr:hypothetical protein CMALT394_290010 [Carnobacterium maltaromaticum]